MEKHEYKQSERESEAEEQSGVELSCLRSRFRGGRSRHGHGHIQPDGNFTSQERDSIMLAIGLVVTMTSLVLGMLVSSAKTFYDGQKTQVAELSSQIVLVSDLMTAYGPETEQVRSEALRSMEGTVDRIWPRKSSQSFELRPVEDFVRFYQHVQLLAPKDEVQASAKAQLLVAALNLRKTYWLMFLQSQHTSVTVPLLSVVTTWLVIIFYSFGLFAPHHLDVVVTLLICAVAVSSAIFVILSMNSPFKGILRLSPAAVRAVLDQMANCGDKNSAA
jgi:hypothetical protein